MHKFNNINLQIIIDINSAEFDRNYDHVSRIIFFSNPIVHPPRRITINFNLTNSILLLTLSTIVNTRVYIGHIIILLYVTICA
jgi:hypothetical protein